MGCCPSSCHESCPETTPVTVNLTTLAFDGANAFFHEQRFSVGANTVLEASGRRVLIPLPYTPVSPASVTVFGNSGAMRPGADYVISGAYLYLVDEAASDSEYLVKWFSMDGATLTSTGDTPWKTGDLNSFFTPAAGWLAMDGVTANDKAAYPALWAYLVLNSDLIESSTTTHFVLKELSAPFYTGTTLTTIRTYIKV